MHGLYETDGNVLKASHACDRSERIQGRLGGGVAECIRVMLYVGTNISVQKLLKDLVSGWIILRLRQQQLVEFS